MPARSVPAFGVVESQRDPRKLNEPLQPLSYLILSYLISSVFVYCWHFGHCFYNLTVFPLHHLFLSIICSISWVGERCQEGWSETLALTQRWYAVTAAEAGRGGSRTRRETQDWLIETGVRTRDQTLTQNSHMKRPALPRPHILSVTASLCFHFVLFFVLENQQLGQVWSLSVLSDMSVCECHCAASVSGGLADITAQLPLK